jgi:hypothetical protein
MKEQLVVIKEQIDSTVGEIAEKLHNDLKNMMSVSL